MKVRIRWAGGAILPVLTREDATPSELCRLLHFACSAQDQIVLRHNGVKLEPDAALSHQMVKEDDIIDAYVVCTRDDRLARTINSLVLEAARISDLKYDQLELSKRWSPSVGGSSSEEDYYDSLLDEETCTQSESSLPASSEPLPVLWKESSDERESVDRPPIPFRSVEEAANFLEEKGCTVWRW